MRDEEGEARKEGGAVRKVTDLATVWCPCDYLFRDFSSGRLWEILGLGRI